MPDPSPILPPDVIALIEARAGAGSVRPLRAAHGGFSHLTAHARIAGAACVVKASNTVAGRAELLRERDALATLGPGVPSARLRFDVADETWVVLVLEELPGESGVRLFAGAHDALASAYTQLGEALARVHAQPAPPALPAMADVYAGAGLATLDLSSGLRAALRDALSHPAWRAGPARLVHGDAGLHNVLWRDGRLVALLDWEWACGGNAQLDLAWLRWTQRWRAMPDEMWDAALSGYASGGGDASVPPPDEARALALGQIAMILMRSRENAPAFAEWMRRLAWTLRA